MNEMLIFVLIKRRLKSSLIVSNIAYLYNNTRSLHLIDFNFLCIIIFSMYLFLNFRVTLGDLKSFLNTSCITNLSFLGCQELGIPQSQYFLYFLNIFGTYTV